MSGACAAMLSFFGDTVTLNTDTVNDANLGDSAARWRLDADGQVYWSRQGVAGGAYQAQYNWVTPASNAANYECTWTAGTGTVDTTPVAEGTYAALTSDRTWEEVNVTGLESATFTARIRRVNGTVDVKTALITITVDGSP